MPSDVLDTPKNFHSEEFWRIGLRTAFLGYARIETDPFSLLFARTSDDRSTFSNPNHTDKSNFLQSLDDWWFEFHLELY